MVQNFLISLFLTVSPEAGQELALDRLLHEYKNEEGGTFLWLQALGLYASNAGGTGLIPAWGTEIPAATW